MYPQLVGLDINPYALIRITRHNETVEFFPHATLSIFKDNDDFYLAQYERSFFKLSESTENDPYIFEIVNSSNSNIDHNIICTILSTQSRQIPSLIITLENSFLIYPPFGIL